MQVKVEDLGRADVKILTRILYLDINNFQERETAVKLIAELPSYLRRSRILSLVIDKLGILPEPSSSACFTHKSLNREIIHAICGFIRTEVGDGLNWLATNQTKLSPEQRRMVHDLRTVNGLWMTRQSVEREYLIRPSFTWFYQGDGCEACMIGRFARDRAVLTDMRTVLLSRIGRRKARALPPLVRWVEEFMSCHGPSSLEMFLFSGEDALKLKALRRDIKSISSQGYSPDANPGRLKRAESNVTPRPSRWVSINTRQGTRRPRSFIADRQRESDSQAPHNENDAENEIIDCYINDTLEDPDPVRATESKRKPELESRRRCISSMTKGHLTGSEMLQRSQSLRTYINTYSDPRHNSQINPDSPLGVPDSRTADSNDALLTQRRKPAKHARTNYEKRSNAKFDQYFDLQTPLATCNGSGMTRSHTTKTSKEYATEYRTLLGERSRVVCYSPSNYSRVTLDEAPIDKGDVEGEGQRQGLEDKMRPISEATTHWSMMDQADILSPPIRPIPPLRIRKEKRKIGVQI
ncbi:uncharacterized protein GIQ15_03813 [Arthroderma uncinatum]|uniref:uncharacterized protein n=1 Tax=Arthroderma uncinatum TaxID=74035 RepID=UPI00144ABE5A|nr:uncharacterized protein GIQ15_03813 [Arthroderma uncinatum]KAF3481054.1 hypothetical protein GIQ15_03813 [Arthroderma uncinatum]